MTIAVFGASGRTGKLVCELGVKAGHQIRAIVRDPQKVAMIEGIEIVQADVFNQNQVESALKNVDAVINCLGSNDLGKTNLQETTIQIIIKAMQVCNVKRIVILGASGALHDPMCNETLGRKIFFVIIRNTLLKNPMNDSGAQQKIIEASDLDYTVVHPPRLLDIPAKGAFRTDPNGLPRGGRELGRADLATYMLSLLEDPSSIRTGPYIAY